MKSMQDRIALMEQQLRALKGRHYKAEAKRKREASAQARLNEARRHSVLGELVLAKVKGGEISELQLRNWLKDERLSPEDRQLFGL